MGEKRMSYDRIGNTRIRENGKKRNLFDKVNEIRTALQRMIPEIQDDELLGMLSRCRAYYEKRLHYGRRGIPENQKHKHIAAWVFKDKSYELNLKLS